MKIIVDTSVWSLALRRPAPAKQPKVQKLEELIQIGEGITLLGIIVTELLQGVRDKGRFQELKGALEPFPLIEPSRDNYLFAADLANRCLAKGIQASTIDFLIAATAIQHEASLMTTDQDFDHMALVAPELKLI